MLAPYAARLALLLARELPKERLPFLAEVRLPMRVWPTDIDFYGHANNGSYLTLMDVGRYQLALRTGLYRWMLRNNGWPVLGGAVVRFRREVRLMARFELVTRLRGWKDRWFFIDQRFEKDGCVHASAIHKAVMRRRGKSVDFGEVAASFGVDASPPLPDLDRWEAVLTPGERRSVASG